MVEGECNKEAAGVFKSGDRALANLVVVEEEKRVWGGGGGGRESCSLRTSTGSNFGQQSGPNKTKLKTIPQGVYDQRVEAIILGHVCWGTP